MRCVYADYKDLHNRYGHIIESFTSGLRSEAGRFYGQAVNGYAISDIAYPPNNILIDDIVLNTVSDLDRVMAYHPVEKPTRYKYAAYIGFWWQRGKPFLCKLHDYSTFRKIEDENVATFFLELCKSLNELFITNFMLSLIQRQSTGGGCADHSNTFKYVDLQDSLHYFLKYRHYTAQELELFLKGLDTCPLIV
jgi:hypothetical protein